MTTTNTPSLPLTLQELQTLLPAAPADTAVTRALEAIACVDRSIRTQVAELDNLERIDQRDVGALVEAAGTSDMTKAVNAVKPSNRAAVELRIDMLRKARAKLARQHDRRRTQRPRLRRVA